MVQRAEGSIVQKAEGSHSARRWATHEYLPETKTCATIPVALRLRVFAPSGSTRAPIL